MKIRIIDYFPMHPGNYWRFHNGASFVALNYGPHPKSSAISSIPLVHCWTSPKGTKEYVHLVNTAWEGLSDIGSWKETPAGERHDIFTYWPPKLMIPAEITLPFEFEYKGEKHLFDDRALALPLLLNYRWSILPMFVTPVGTFNDVLLLEEDWGSFRWYMGFRPLIGVVGYGIYWAESNKSEIGLLAQYFSYDRWLDEQRKE